MIRKRSVKVSGHATSISLENEFWEELKAIAAQRQQSINELITELDDANPRANLSSVIRVFVLKNLKTG